MAAARLRRGRERQPAVAAQAPMPTDAVIHPGDERIFGTKLRRVRPDQLVPLHAADEELPMKPGTKPSGLDHARRRTVMAGRLRENHSLKGPGRSTDQPTSPRR